GFIAENIREGVKEQKDIQENMFSLIEDLKSDIKRNEISLIRNEKSIQLCDSLITALNHGITNTNNIYFYARSVTANIGYLYPNARTFELLKSSGLLNAIKNNRLANHISYYYAGFQSADYQTALIRQKILDIHEVNADVLDAFVMQEQLPVKISDSLVLRKVTKPTNNPPLLTSEKVQINRVALHYLYFKYALILYDMPVKELNKRAKELIEEIQKEYHLETK
ncbi:MAG: hypothetical protein ACKO96_00220, partial [Flammeovirgaceae bacterium]